MSPRWMLWLVACGGGPPLCGGEPPPEALVQLGAAVDAFRAFSEALERGDHDAAARHLAAAREARPDDALLVGWEAWLLVARGDLEGGIARAEEALRRAPELATLRYDLACWKARAGDLEGAAVDLRVALADGATTPRAARADPDLAPHAAQPALADVLPAAAVEARADGPSRPITRGQRAEVVVEVVAPPAAGVPTVEGPITGPFRVVEVVVAVEPGPDGDPRRTLRYAVRAVGDGEGTFGPLRVAVGEGGAVAVDAVALRAVDPLRGAPDPADRALPPSPEAVLADRPVPSAWVDDGGAWVVAPFGARVTLTPDAAPRRRDRVDTPDRAVELWRLPPGARTVRVEVDDEVRLERVLPGEPSR